VLDTATAQPLLYRGKKERGGGGGEPVGGTCFYTHAKHANAF